MSTLKVDAIRHNSATSDAITTAADGTCTARITGMTGGGGLSHRNKVINGGMMVHQRGDQSATGSAGYFACDRFKTNNGCAAQVAITKSTDTPDGFANSTKWDCTTADTSVGANNYFLIQHRLEGQDIQDFAKGTSSAKQFALSFYIKATKTGVYTVELEDVDNSRHCSKTITVSDTNWNRYEIIYPADTTGAFVNDNNFSLSINFWLLGGSDYTSGTLQSSSWGTGATTRCSSSNVNAMDSTSNNFFLTGVQLEVGGTVTSFEHKRFSDELIDCQRYYQTLPSGLISVRMAQDTSYSNAGLQSTFILPSSMRAMPSLLNYSDGTSQITHTFYDGNYSNALSRECNMFGAIHNGTVRFNFNYSAALNSNNSLSASYKFGISQEAIAFEAEL